MLRLRLAVLFIGFLDEAGGGAVLSLLLLLQEEVVANNLDSVIVRERFLLIERFLNFISEYIF